MVCRTPFVYPREATSRGESSKCYGYDNLVEIELFLMELYIFSQQLFLSSLNIARKLKLIQVFYRMCRRFAQQFAKRRDPILVAFVYTTILMGPMPSKGRGVGEDFFGTSALHLQHCPFRSGDFRKLGMDAS